MLALSGAIPYHEPPSQTTLSPRVQSACSLSFQPAIACNEFHVPNNTLGHGWANGTSGYLTNIRLLPPNELWLDTLVMTA